MEEPQTLYRAEAVEHHAKSRERGHILRITPSWMRWTYWLVLGLIALTFTFASLAKVSEYAIGPAIVRVEPRTEVTATVAGTVESVEAQPGQRVRTGDVL